MNNLVANLTLFDYTRKYMEVVKVSFALGPFLRERFAVTVVKHFEFVYTTKSIELSLIQTILIIQELTVAVWSHFRPKRICDELNQIPFLIDFLLKMVGFDRVSNVYFLFF